MQPVTGPSVQGSSLRTRVSRIACAVVFLAWCFLFPGSRAGDAASTEESHTVPEILSRAESLFLSMKARDYPAIFAVLSSKSRETIVEETTSAMDAVLPTTAKLPSHDRDAVRNDFAAGGPIAKEYWDAYLSRFDPDIALEESRWEIGSVGKDRAEILLTHHGADRPAKLQLFHEDGTWKVGLVETFWTR